MVATVGSIEVTEGAGKKLDTTTVTTTEGTVHREGTFLGDPETAAARQKVTDADPGASDYGAVVRIAGTVPLPSGASTAANQATVIAALASLLTELGAKTEPVDQQHAIIDSSALPANAAQETGGNLDTLATLPLAQASTTASQKGVLGLAAVTETEPRYTDAQTSPLSLTSRGALRVAASTTDRDATAQMVFVLHEVLGELRTMNELMEEAFGLDLRQGLAKKGGRHFAMTSRRG